MKIWATKREYLEAITTNIDTVRDTAQLFGEISSQKGEDLYVYESESGTTFDFPANSVEYFFKTEHLVEKIKNEDSNIFDFLEKLRKLFEANPSLSSIFIEVEK